MNRVDKIFKDKFSEGFLTISACWFWLMSIIYLLGGLVPGNYELTFTFEQLLVGFLFFNMCSFVVCFVFATYHGFKKEK